MLKMAKDTLNIYWCEHHDIFKVYLGIFQYYIWELKGLHFLQQL